jgi:hypothetical protein
VLVYDQEKDALGVGKFQPHVAWSIHHVTGVGKRVLLVSRL